MSFESLMARLQTLNSSVEALAAIGGELRLRREELNCDPRVRPLIQEVVQLIDPGLLDGIDAEQERTALAFIQTSFRQAADLMENPERAPGWSYADPVILESQGQLSRQIVRGILIRWPLSDRISVQHCRKTVLFWISEPALGGSRSKQRVPGRHCRSSASTHGSRH